MTVGIPVQGVRVGPARVPVGGAEGRGEVGEGVRQVRGVELLRPAEPDEPPGQPVGDDDDVPADVLAGRELRLDLAEELDVVVDVLGVLDLDAGPFGERVQRRPVLLVVADVHVLGPVGEVDHLLLGRVVRRRGGLAVRLLGGRDAAPGEPGEAADGERAEARGPHQRTAGQGAPAAGQAALYGGQLGPGQAVRLVLLHALCALSGGGDGRWSDGRHAAAPLIGCFIGPRRSCGASPSRRPPCCRTSHA